MCGRLRLRLRLRALALLLLPLLLPGAGGACGPPPPLRGARPAGPAAASYPEGADVTYECEAGLRKVPGMLQTRRCLRGSAWSALEPFCARSCSDPVRSRFAQLSHEDATKSFYPVGSTVRYVCRSAYENVSETHPTSTCLENLAWSDIPELCKRKSCGAPKGPEHGRAAVVTGFLYGDSVEITCDAGYQLTGQRLIRCQLKGDQVAWTDLPTCQLMATPPTTPKSDPPGRADTAVNSTGMNIGQSFIDCTLKGDKVEWSKLPVCQLKSAPVGNGSKAKLNSGTTENEAIKNLPEEAHPNAFRHSFSISTHRGSKKYAGSSIKPRYYHKPFHIPWKSSYPAFLGPRNNLKNRVLGSCVSPSPRRFVAPLYTNRIDYPAGSSRTSHCHHGYMGISGMLPSATCFQNTRWSEVPMLCGKRSWSSRGTKAWQSCCYNRFPIRCKSTYYP